MEVAKEVAKMLDVIPNAALQLRERWMFCSAPILINSCDHMRVLKVWSGLPSTWGLYSVGACVDSSLQSLLKTRWQVSPRVVRAVVGLPPY